MDESIIAEERTRGKEKNWYYYRELERICQFKVPQNSSVLEIGCGDGALLASLRPKRGRGFDVSQKLIESAREQYPHYQFSSGSYEDFNIYEKFDYIILSNIVGEVDDVQDLFHSLHRVTTSETRIIIINYNYLWEPLLRIGEKFGFKRRQKLQNWLSFIDLKNLLYLSGYEVVNRGNKLLCPKPIPLLARLINQVIVNLPVFQYFGLVQLTTAKEIVPRENYDDFSCSVIVPCRNERGNIEGAVARTPDMGKHTELIFIDGNSTDGTVEEIERVMAANKERDISLILQGNGTGKGDAVRKGFAAAKGDVLMILDADLTVPPEDLPRFFNALVEGKGEFINGSRLVYQMEKEAMRFLNLLGNKFFGLMFTYLLDQKFKDTLCGTKVLLKRDYEKIARGRSFFGDFDPFGDFDLIFGAAKQNLKIVEIPIRYRDRTYGSTNISRFRHGWLLLKMCVVAMKKVKYV